MRLVPWIVYTRQRSNYPSNRVVWNIELKAAISMSLVLVHSRRRSAMVSMAPYRLRWSWLNHKNWIQTRLPGPFSRFSDLDPLWARERRWNLLALKVIHEDFPHAPTGAHHQTRVPYWPRTLRWTLTVARDCTWAILWRLWTTSDELNSTYHPKGVLPRGQWP